MLPGTPADRQAGRQREGGADMKNRRIVVTSHGAPDVLQVVEEDLPEPGPGEVREGPSRWRLRIRPHAPQLRYAPRYSARAVYPG
jgi:hypothetical protein